MKLYIKRCKMTTLVTKDGFPVSTDGLVGKAKACILVQLYKEDIYNDYDTERFPIGTINEEESCYVAAKLVPTPVGHDDTRDIFVSASVSLDDDDIEKLKTDGVITIVSDPDGPEQEYKLFGPGKQCQITIKMEPKSEK